MKTGLRLAKWRAKHYFLMQSLPRNRISVWADNGHIPSAYYTRTIFGFGFVIEPLSGHPFAFRSPSLQGPMESTRLRAIISWFNV